ALLLDLLADQCAPLRQWNDLMSGERRAAGGTRHPGPGSAGRHRADLPHQSWHPRLLDREALAHGEAGPVKGIESRDGGSPFGPAIYIAEDLPHQRCWSVDVNTAAGNHVPHGT